MFVFATVDSEEEEKQEQELERRDTSVSIRIITRQDWWFGGGLHSKNLLVLIMPSLCSQWNYSEMSGSAKMTTLLFLLTFAMRVQEERIFAFLYSVHQIENFCMDVGPEFKLEENEDRNKRNRLLHLIKCVFLNGWCFSFKSSVEVKAILKCPQVKQLFVWYM